MSFWNSTSTRARPGLGLALTLLLASLSGSLTACNRCESDAKPVASQAPAVAPAPVPRQLLFDVFVPKPSATWRSVRELAGPAARMLPVNVELLVARFLGLKPIVAGRIEADRPWLGAVLRSASGEEPGWVFAVRVQSGAELIAELTRGNTPSHRASQSGGLTLLEGSEPGSARSFAVVDDYLVMGENPAALKLAASYAARTLPRREMPPKSISMVAGRGQLRGAAVSFIESSWRSYKKQLDEQRKRTQRAHGGRAPDFAEPTAVLGALDAWVEEFTSYARSSERLEVAFQPSKTSASLSLELVPTQGGKAESWVDRIAVGSASSVLSLPTDATLAFWSKSSPADRASQADTASAGLKSLLGTRLSESDAKSLHGIFDNLSKGRGDELLVGFVVAPQPGLLVRGSVSEESALAEGLSRLPSLLEVSPLAEPLASFVGRPRVVAASSGLPGTRAARIEFVSAGQPASAGQKLEAIWANDDKQYRWVAGPAPARALFQLLSEPPATLKRLGTLEKRLADVSHASSVLLLNPSRLGLLDAGAKLDDMVLFVATKHKGRASVDVELPADVVRAAMASGF